MMSLGRASRARDKFESYMVLREFNHVELRSSVAQATSGLYMIRIHVSHAELSSSAAHDTVALDVLLLARVMLTLS